MSYVSENRRGNPVGMGAAILVNGSIILAVALSPIIAEYTPVPTIITGRNIENDPPPPPNKPVAEQKTKKADPTFTPERVIDTKTQLDPGDTTDTTQTATGRLSNGTGGGDFLETVPPLAKPTAPGRAAALEHRAKLNKIGQGVRTQVGSGADLQADTPLGKLRQQIGPVQRNLNAMPDAVQQGEQYRVNILRVGLRHVCRGLQTQRLCLGIECVPLAQRRTARLIGTGQIHRHYFGQPGGKLHDLAIERRGESSVHTENQRRAHRVLGLHRLDNVPCNRLHERQPLGFGQPGRRTLVGVEAQL